MTTETIPALNFILKPKNWYLELKLQKLIFLTELDKFYSCNGLFIPERIGFVNEY